MGIARIACLLASFAALVIICGCGTTTSARTGNPTPNVSDAPPLTANSSAIAQSGSGDRLEPPTGESPEALQPIIPIAGPESTPVVPEPQSSSSVALGSATTAFEENRLDDAEQKLIEATALNVNDANAQYLLALVRARKGNPSGAIDSAERCLAARPGDINAMRLIVQQQLARGKAEDALRFLERQRSSENIPIEVEILRHRCLVHLGRAQQVIEESESLLKRDETNVGTMINLASAYALLRKNELSLYVLENSLDIQPTVAAYMMLANITFSQGKIRQALNWAQQAKNLNPKVPEVLNTIGVFLHQLGDSQGALQELDQALALAPNEGIIYINLGNAYRGLRRFKEAERAYKRALEIDPNSAHAVYDLGILYFESPVEGLDDLRRYNAAVDFFNRFKSLVGAAITREDPVDKYIAEARKIIQDIQQSQQDALKEAPQVNKSPDSPPPASLPTPEEPVTPVPPSSPMPETPPNGTDADNPTSSGFGTNE